MSRLISSLFLYDMCRRIRVPENCFYMIANAVILLQFVLMYQTRPIAEQVNSNIFFKMSRIWHHFRLVYPQNVVLLVLFLPRKKYDLSVCVNCCIWNKHRLTSVSIYDDTLVELLFNSCSVLCMCLCHTQTKTKATLHWDLHADWRPTYYGLAAVPGRKVGFRWLGTSSKFHAIGQPTGNDQRYEPNQRRIL